VDARTAYRPDSASSRRVGGLSAVALGLSYIAITVLYLIGGALPDDPAGRLTHLADHAATWWMILVLSVATDLLFLPVMWALYVLLKDVSRNAMLAGTGLVGLFVVLDLAVTWPNYSVLISLGDAFAAATDDSQRAALLAAATYAVEVLSSGLWGVYAILVPAAGIFVIGLVMLKGGFGKVTAYVGLATGILGVVSVAGPLVVDAAEVAAILAAILTTVWVLLVGYKLLSRAVRPAAMDQRPAR
jgi:Domain of unknown function (DUF4386)